VVIHPEHYHPEHWAGKAGSQTSLAYTKVSSLMALTASYRTILIPLLSDINVVHMRDTVNVLSNAKSIQFAWLNVSVLLLNHYHYHCHIPKPQTCPLLFTKLLRTKFCLR